jgi:hypothetical protein
MSKYFEHLRSLIEIYGLAEDQRVPWSEDLEPVLKNLGAMPRFDTWRAYSRLCVDGAPVEFVEKIGETRGELSVDCDTGPYGANPAERLRHAVDLASPYWPEIHSLRAALFPAHVPVTPFSLWLGFSGTGTKLYWNLSWLETDDAWRRALAALEVVGCEPDGETTHYLRLLGARGFPKMLALGRSRNSETAAKIYFRLTEPVNWPQFDCYRRRILQRGRDWNDPNVGVGVQFGRGGHLSGLSLYHYTSSYFRDDDELRRRLLDEADAFRWDTDVYRTTSRLIEGGPGSRLRGMAGFAWTPAGRTKLQLYSTSGYLAESAAEEVNA